MAEDLLAILKPFHDATEVVSGEKYPTVSILSPLLHKLINITLEEKEDDSTFAKDVTRAIRVDLQGTYLDEDVQEKIRLSSYLDPRFKALPFLSAEDKTVVMLTAKSELVTMIESDRQLETGSNERGESGEVPTCSSTDQQSLSPPVKRKKLETLLEDVCGQTLHATPSTSDEIAEAELRRYEAEGGVGLECNNPLEWWKARSSTYLYLSKLARKILCITATSVPSERLFSTAGNMVSEKRSCLLSENVDRLVFLYENM